MELRTLQYYLAVIREESITAAARSLHLSQPALSAQLKQLEQELGTPLFVGRGRGARRLVLTEEGLLLKKRAEEILSLVGKTEQEFSTFAGTLTGEVRIGAAESQAITHLAQTARAIQDKHPAVQFNIFSSNRATVLEQLEKGLVDFGVIYGETDPARFGQLPLPHKDEWRVLMRQDSPLSKKEVITPADLIHAPLILSRTQKPVLDWLGQPRSQLHITATCNLIYNIAILVQSGFGYALTLVEPITAQGLCLRPLDPPVTESLFLVWKKNQVFSKASELFLLEMKHAH